MTHYPRSYFFLPIVNDVVETRTGEKPQQVGLESQLCCRMHMQIGTLSEKCYKEREYVEGRKEERCRSILSWVRDEKGKKAGVERPEDKRCEKKLSTNLTD